MDEADPRALGRRMIGWKRARRVLLCVTGGIAAYKIPELVSRLVRLDCEVEILMTRAAERLVSPLALATLSGRRVWRQRSEEHTSELQSR
mgnify:CR=1 FL=1